MAGTATAATYAAIVTSVVAAASAALTIQGQRVNASQQEEQQKRLVAANAEQMAQNRALATESFLAQSSQEMVKLGEEREAAGQASFSKHLEGEQARGTVKAAAAEANVDGVSLSSLLSDFYRQEATFNNRYATNLSFREKQSSYVQQSLFEQANARRLSTAPYQPSPIAPVNYAGPLLNATQQGLNTFVTTQYYNRGVNTNPTDPTTGVNFKDTSVTIPNRRTN